ncbi:MAG: MBOAT family O-acyltransferase [Devosia sp.]
MLFNSLEFPIFLVAALGVFAASPPQWRWSWLLAASYLFYGWGNPANLTYLGAVTGVIYVCGLAMGSTSAAIRRSAFVAGLLAVLGSLFVFKFYDFLAGELQAASGVSLPRLGIVAPAGYSFYAFMAASYLIDAWRGDLAPERHAGQLALYLAWFPKILAGPIERVTSFLPQVRSTIAADPARTVSALQLIGWGLFKKVVIADNLAPVVDNAFAIAAYASPLELLIAVYFFAFQIYCDFSGYADMAIGLSRLFGIDLMENFRRPYLSRGVSEFWSQRWHISLGRWFRDYLYIPLGGSRSGAARTYFNVMAVFIVSGLWHAGLGYGVGWTFLVWGAMNGVYQWAGLATSPVWAALSQKAPKLAKSPWLGGLRILLTFHLILLSWVFFRAVSIDQAVLVLQKIWNGLPDIPGILAHYPFTADHLTGAVLIVLLFGIEVLDERRSVAERLAAMPRPVRWASYYAVIFAIVILGRWQGAEFIYMQF